MSEIVRLSRKAAAEGIVLIQNKDMVLPLKEGEKIALFGRCQLDYYKSGTGSGGAVHVPYSINAVEGLMQYKQITLNDMLLTTYKEWVAKNPFDDGGGGWAAEPWFQEEMPLTDDLVYEASKESDKAIIIIGRTAGEDQDNKDVAGSYRLTEKEQDMINKVTDCFEEVIVILNVSNIIDMSWLNTSYKHPIKGVLYAWHGGMEGGNALADILVGNVTPSGKLTDTIAKDITDYPSNNQFGDEVENFYEEDIYVGYRYFETFNPEAVQFPFGFGLSYTSFKTNIEGFKVVDESIEVTVEVMNTGKYPGKEVLQFYFSSPQGVLGKPKYVLGDFTKTKTLEPTETTRVVLKINKATMASYDDGGETGHKSCYVLEAGDYYFYVGTNSQTLEEVGSYNQSFEMIEKLQEALAPKKPFDRFKAKLENNQLQLTKASVPLQSVDMSKRIANGMPKTMTITDTNYTLQDVEHDKISLDDFVAQLSAEDLATMVKGEGMCSPKVTAGTASAFGGLSPSLQKYGIPVLACADGPSGIRMDSGNQASQVPIGTLLACSWNTELVEKLYEEVAKELVDNHIDTLLGPGMNIHRHPLNGRNFEYFSEDPYVTGKFAIAMTKGLSNGGSTATLKHYLVNNQEEARTMADSIVSERALREIYLKAFEMAVKEGGATSIMTSYNPVNGIYAASNFDLNTTILRNEWGFNGIVMTDWWAKLNHPITGGTGGTYHKSYMVKAQNDLYMVVGNDEAHEFKNDDLMEALENGILTIGELQQSAKNICGFILNSHTYKAKLKHTNKRYFEARTVSEHTIYDAGVPVPDNVFTLRIEEAGTYDVISTARYQTQSMAQSTYNVRINGEIAFMNQMHGSKEDFQSRNIAYVDLEVGFYDIELEFVRKGIEVKEITFKKRH